MRLLVILTLFLIILTACTSEAPVQYPTPDYPTDPACEAEDYMKMICYFKKALDTRNIGYCQGDFDCVRDLAGIWEDKAACQNLLTEGEIINCEHRAETCQEDSDYELCGSTHHACDLRFNYHTYPEGLEEDCMDKYGVVSKFTREEE